eukprot:Sspe_Gene.98934::Locus_72336_Transcript_1_1_Confidence_1.000_Length_1431::g.98934::m.98934
MGGFEKFPSVPSEGTSSHPSHCHEALRKVADILEASPLKEHRRLNTRLSQPIGKRTTAKPLRREVIALESKVVLARAEQMELRKVQELLGSPQLTEQRLIPPSPIASPSSSPAPSPTSSSSPPHRPRSAPLPVLAAFATSAVPHDILSLASCFDLRTATIPLDTPPEAVRGLVEQVLTSRPILALVDHAMTQTISALRDAGCVVIGVTPSDSNDSAVPKNGCNLLLRHPVTPQAVLEASESLHTTTAHSPSQGHPPRSSDSPRRNMSEISCESAASLVDNESEAVDEAEAILTRANNEMKEAVASEYRHVVSAALALREEAAAKGAEVQRQEAVIQRLMYHVRTLEQRRKVEVAALHADLAQLRGELEKSQVLSSSLLSRFHEDIASVNADKGITIRSPGHPLRTPSPSPHELHDRLQGLLTTVTQLRHVLSHQGRVMMAQIDAMVDSTPPSIIEL